MNRVLQAALPTLGARFEEVREECVCSKCAQTGNLELNKNKAAYIAVCCRTCMVRISGHAVLNLVTAVERRLAHGSVGEASPLRENSLCSSSSGFLGSPTPVGLLTPRIRCTSARLTRSTELNIEYLDQIKGLRAQVAKLKHELSNKDLKISSLREDLKVKQVPSKTGSSSGSAARPPAGLVRVLQYPDDGQEPSDAGLSPELPDAGSRKSLPDAGLKKQISDAGKAVAAPDASGADVVTLRVLL